MELPLGKVEGSLLRVGYFSFVSPVSSSAFIKPIFEIKDTEYKKKIHAPTFGSGSGKTYYTLVLWLQVTHQKSMVVGLLLISAQEDQEVLSLYHQQVEVGFRFETLIKIKTEHGGGAVTGNIPSSYKGKIGKNTVIEDVEDDIDELPDSYFSKSSARVFHEIYHGKYGVLTSSKFVDLIETLGAGVHGEDLAGQLRKLDPN